jgi:signal transduction histidine kinase
LASNILEIARIESDQLHLNLRNINLNDIILPLVEDARSQTSNKKMEIEYNPTPIMIKSDIDRFAEVIWNLNSSEKR